MESNIFAVCLFLVTLTILCWLTTPVKVAQEATETTNTNKTETPVLEEIAAQEVVINESLIDSLAGEVTTDDTPVVQDFQEEFINNQPIKEVKNNNSNTQESKQETSGIDLKNIRTYLLHKHRCVKVKDLPGNFQLPQEIKTYNLRGEKVARLSVLEALIAV